MHSLQSLARSSIATFCKFCVALCRRTPQPQAPREAGWTGGWSKGPSHLREDKRSSTLIRDQYLRNMRKPVAAGLRSANNQSGRGTNPTHLYKTVIRYVGITVDARYSYIWYLIFYTSLSTVYTGHALHSQASSVPTRPGRATIDYVDSQTLIGH